ncbi:hypothetical protein CEQ90_08925 [Lewinellaceae bacterium SD302]|nr:hypothetical protein CEQ90_08925 [Lewinellaceae bacterium SD302]
MRNSNHLYIMAIVLSVVSSCGDDPFSQISEIELPEHEPLTAMSLHLVAGDSLMNPYLGQSREITGEEPRTGPDGSLTLFQNGAEVASGTYTTGSDRASGFELIATNKIEALPGDVFQLDGIVGDFGTATSAQVMPAPANIEFISYTVDGGLSIDGDRVDELIVDVTDPVDEENIYAFDVGFYLTRTDNCTDTICDSVNIFRSIYTESIDPIVEDSYDLGNLLRDGTFNGNTYRLRLLVYNSNDDRDEPLFLRVLTLTEDGYRYVVSRTAFEDARFDPFSEPVNVHDNVDNGYGYFMVSNLTEVEVLE